MKPVKVTVTKDNDDIVFTLEGSFVISPLDVIKMSPSAKAAVKRIESGAVRTHDVLFACAALMHDAEVSLRETEVKSTVAQQKRKLYSVLRIIKTSPLSLSRGQVYLKSEFDSISEVDGHLEALLKSGLILQEEDGSYRIRNQDLCVCLDDNGQPLNQCNECPR